MQGIGYTVGALGPLAVGLLHAWSGDWPLPLLFLLAVSVVGIVPAIMPVRPGLVEVELNRHRSVA